jgi:hypothetical protein
MILAISAKSGIEATTRNLASAEIIPPENSKIKNKQ